MQKLPSDEHHDVVQELETRCSQIEPKESA